MLWVPHSPQPGPCPTSFSLYPRETGLLSGAGSGEGRTLGRAAPPGQVCLSFLQDSASAQRQPRGECPPPRGPDMSGRRAGRRS